jgi:hypothetical protein
MILVSSLVSKSGHQLLFLTGMLEGLALPRSLLQ